LDHGLVVVVGSEVKKNHLNLNHQKKVMKIKKEEKNLSYQENI